MKLPSHDGGDIPPYFSEEVTLDAPVPVVWEHLANPRSMSEWLGGEDYSVAVDTTWEVGSAIVVRGVHHLPFESRDVVLAFKPCQALSFTQLNSLSLLPDQPSSYTTLHFVLEAAGHQTILRLKASGFSTSVIYKHLQFYWRVTLDVFKTCIEACHQAQAWPNQTG